MSWTDDRVETLRKLWGEGKTAAEIAKELGGVTRNAVIGKAHRLKLSNRVSPIQQNKKPLPKPANQQKTVQPKEKKTAPVAKTVVVKTDQRNVPLSELKANECRWADGDPREKDFGFCGCRTVAGLPYCAEHAKVAYQAATRNRIIKAEEREAQDVTAEELEMAKKVVRQK